MIFSCFNRKDMALNLQQDFNVTKILSQFTHLKKANCLFEAIQERQKVEIHSASAHQPYTFKVNSQTYPNVNVSLDY